LACVNGHGYLTGGEECLSSSDCGLLPNAVAQVCSGVACVALCQYHDDPALMACATHPGLGLVNSCSRNHARAVTVAAKVFGCGDERVATASCKAPTATFSPHYESFVACVLSRLTQPCSAVFIGTSSCHAVASESLADYFTELRTHLDLTIAPRTGGGTGGTCGSDCDCGHCQYCERGTCYYAGEGPYGCYRGCN
jgi:hypothetical protein